MQQRTTFFWPAAILLGFCVMLGLMMSGFDAAPITAQSTCPTAYSAADCAATVSARTASAVAVTQTAQARPSNTSYPINNSPTATSTQTPQPNQPDAPVTTPTFTPTATSTVAGVATPTFTATPTTAPLAPPVSVNPGDNGASIPTATSILPVGVEVRACLPSDPIEITGRGQSGTPLIVTFDKRPVGGGSVRADGTYRITLRIGLERPGLYLVVVEQRDTRQVLQQFGCDVPPATPQPTLVAPNGSG